MFVQLDVESGCKKTISGMLHMLVIVACYFAVGVRNVLTINGMPKKILGKSVCRSITKLNAEQNAQTLTCDLYPH